MARLGINKGLRQRILEFSPAWFTVCMGTGVASQILVNFPYPIDGGPFWMRVIAYIFWMTDIVLFGIFTLMFLVQYSWHPKLFKKTVLGFPDSAYLGAVPIALDTIIVGIMSFYDYQDSARWAAFVLWWVAVAMTLAVSFGLLIAQMLMQHEHTLDEVAGLWLMTCVPMLVTSAAGATQLPYMSSTSEKCAITILIVSFLLWSCGLMQVHLILGVYFWRLISKKLPKRELLASGLLPLAPLGQGAYAAQVMSIFMSNYLKSRQYAPTQSQPPPISQSVLLSTGEAIHWLGIFTSLFLLAEATFWLVHVVASLIYKRPKSFNIGLWSLTFPLGSYANGWEYLSRDLRNDGMRGWSAFLVVVTILLWLFCAVPTVYLGFWKGDLFQSPGLEEWLDPERKKEDEERGREHQQNGQNGVMQRQRPNSTEEAES